MELAAKVRINAYLSRMRRSSDATTRLVGAAIQPRQDEAPALSAGDFDVVRRIRVGTAASALGPMVISVRRAA